MYRVKIISKGGTSPPICLVYLMNDFIRYNYTLNSLPQITLESLNFFEVTVITFCCIIALATALTSASGTFYTQGFR